MACNTYKGKTADGKPYAVIVCGPRARTRKCAYCLTPHTKLCDFKFAIPGGWKICDKPLCDACARPTGPDTDVCRAHPVAAPVAAAFADQPEFL